MNDAEKAAKVKTWLEALAGAQPAQNYPWVWAMEGLGLPPVALAQLYDVVEANR